jgi:hypothetical protein
MDLPIINNNNTLLPILTCEICGDLLRSAVSFIECGHTGCSVCMNRALLQMDVPACPQCRRPSSQAELIPNRSLQQIVEIVKNNESYLTTNQTSNSNSSIDQVISNNTNESLTVGTTKRLRQDSSDTITSTTTTTTTKRGKKKPIPVYALLSDLDLLKELQNIGFIHFSNTTPRDIMISTLTEFVLLYNSYIDSFKEPNIGEIIHSLMENRNAREKEANRDKKVAGIQKFVNRNNNNVATTSSSTSHNDFSSTNNVITTAQNLYRKRQRAKWTWQRVPEEWRAVWSSELNRPIYYNSRTNECTVEKPPRIFDDEGNNSNVVVVIADD